jgi:hypothetical protein
MYKPVLNLKCCGWCYKEFEFGEEVYRSETEILCAMCYSSYCNMLLSKI